MDRRSGGPDLLGLTAIEAVREDRPVGCRPDAGATRDGHFGEPDDLWVRPTVVQLGNRVERAWVTGFAEFVESRRSSLWRTAWAALRTTLTEADRTAAELIEQETD